MPRNNYVQAAIPYAEFPMIRQVGRMQISATGAAILNAHRNRGIELCFIRKGRYDWEADGAVHHLKAGDGFVTLPWQPHGAAGGGAMNRGRLDFIVIDIGTLQPNAKWRMKSWSGLAPEECEWLRKILSANASPHLPEFERLGRLFESLFEEIFGRRPAREPLVRLRLAEMLLAAGRFVATRERPPATDELVDAALKVIAQRLDHPWQLAEMAAIAGLGRTRFAERVRHRTGAAPMEALEEMRIDEAKRLLRQTDLPVTNIAMTVGYGTSQYFSTVFRKTVGTTPTRYRKSVRV